MADMSRVRGSAHLHVLHSTAANDGHLMPCHLKDSQLLHNCMNKKLATAQGPLDVLCQLKSCQLQSSSVYTAIMSYRYQKIKFERFAV